MKWKAGKAAKITKVKQTKKRQPKTNNPFAFRASAAASARAAMFVFVLVLVLVFVFFFQHVARFSYLLAPPAALAFCLFAWLLPSQPQHVELQSNML